MSVGAASGRKSSWLAADWYRIPDSEWIVPCVSAAFAEYIQETHETQETGSVRVRIRHQANYNAAASSRSASASAATDASRRTRGYCGPTGQWRLDPSHVCRPHRQLPRCARARADARKRGAGSGRWPRRARHAGRGRSPLAMASAIDRRSAQSRPSPRRRWRRRAPPLRGRDRARETASCRPIPRRSLSLRGTYRRPPRSSPR
jgi:hypothetical protein